MIFMYTSYSSEQLDKIFSAPRSIYFIGIGGISMSSLAHIAHDSGLKVGGYDRTPSELTSALESQGVDINYTLDPSHIDGWDVIVYTAAVKPDNPELAKALEYDRKGKKFCVYRADFLGWLMSGSKNRIGVAGMHGKSTTTAMLAHIFLAAERDPTIVLGAEMTEIGGAYRTGNGNDFIMEACEYQDSFLSFKPNIAVILNIDLDHTDYFSGIDQIIDSFAKYASIANDGYAVYNADSPNVAAALKDYKGRRVTFALESDADFKADIIGYENGRAEFDIKKNGVKFAHVSLSVTGKHNVMNSLAAAAAADICGVPAEAIERGLASYSGAKRRMEYRGAFKTDSGDYVPLYDDYAHHPTEIRATLSGAREMGKRIWVVFQPHTYSRTASLYSDFAGAFEGVNVVLAPIYAARETNEYGVSSEKLALDAGGMYLSSFEKIAAYLKKSLRDGDMLIVMGAGDIIKLDGLLLDKAEKRA